MEKVVELAKKRLKKLDEPTGRFCRWGFLYHDRSAPVENWTQAEGVVYGRRLAQYFEHEGPCYGGLFYPFDKLNKENVMSWLRPKDL